MSIFNESENQQTPQQADTPNTAAISDAILRMRSGANWFYWIAALSLINSIVLIAGGQWNFIVGLGFTQVIDGIMRGMSESNGFSAFSVVALMLNVLIAAIFALFGYFAGRGSVLMFITGIFIYVLDALLYIFVGDYLAAGFHAFALFFIIRGMMAAVEFNSAMKDGQMIQN